MTPQLWVRELVANYRATDVPYPVEPIDNATRAVEVVEPMIGNASEEHMIALLTNARHRLLAVTRISQGGVDGAPIDPRVVFRAALLANATGLILVHNHPSGEVTPSREDAALTTRIEAGAKLLGLTLLDSIILGGDGRYFSMREAGVFVNTA